MGRSKFIMTDQLCQIVDKVYTRLKEQADKISNDSDISQEQVIVTVLQGGETIWQLGVAVVTGGVAAAEVISAG